MANEMPVLPLVGSRIVHPGVRRPSASARSTIARATRSLMDPVGLRSSSFAHSRTSGDGDKVGRPTSGVLPTESTRLSKRMGRGSAAGYGRQDDNRRAVGHGGVQAAGEADVLVVDVDVHEP